MFQFMEVFRICVQESAVMGGRIELLCSRLGLTSLCIPIEQSMGSCDELYEFDL